LSGPFVVYLEAFLITRVELDPSWLDDELITLFNGGVGLAIFVGEEVCFVTRKI
jgi:hypothetical protein